MLDQRMKPLRVKGRTPSSGPHTSVTQTVLGALPSVALSSEWVIEKNMDYTVAQSFFNYTDQLGAHENGNFNCR
jgi:hypothetical protein